MYKNYSMVVNSDCPNCGKKEGAFMGASSWGHNISCCSEKCGLEIKAKIDENVATKEYQSAIKALHKAKEKVRAIKYKNTGVSGSPVEGLFGEL